MPDEVMGTTAKTYSILDLEGLGKEIWEGVDSAVYVRELRDGWKSRRAPYKNRSCRVASFAADGCRRTTEPVKCPFTQGDPCMRLTRILVPAALLAAASACAGTGKYTSVARLKETKCSLS